MTVLPPFNSQLDPGQASPSDAADLQIAGVNCRYGRAGGLFRRRVASPLAIDNVSLSVGAGETLAIVGESGSGKSTLARAIAGLMPVAEGQIRFGGVDITRVVERRERDLQRRIQIIFQNPDASLNRRHRVGSILERPLQLFFGLSRAQREVEVRALLAAVQLPAYYADRYPSEISGGEKQRVAIARALAARPSLLLCDEIVSALDVSVQATVLELLRGIQRRTHLSVVFITHDLAVVRWFADRVAVLYGGQLCEVAPVERLYEPPYHPYTAVLLRAAPSLGKKRTAASVRAGSGTTKPSKISTVRKPGACAFASQCPHAIADLCDQVSPPWRQIAPDHAIRCHLEARQLAAVSVA